MRYLLVFHGSSGYANAPLLRCTYVACLVINARWTNCCVCKCSLSVSAGTRVTADDALPLHSHDCFHRHKPTDHSPRISVASSGQLHQQLLRSVTPNDILYVIDNGRPTYLLQGATYDIVGWLVRRSHVEGENNSKWCTKPSKLLCNVRGTYIVWNCGRGPRFGDPCHRCYGDVARNSFYC
jgi:hypothetical protein